LTARRPVLALILVTATALLWSSAACAASPQRIYKDLADNGRLDGKYSKADLARALNLQHVVKTDKAQPAPATPTVAPKATPARRSNRRVPFTGLDLALLTVGGGPLLLIGIGLRRRLSPTAEPAGIIGS
jgi:hypothetical protein